MNKLMLLISAGILFAYSSCKQPETKETPAPHIDMKLFFKNPAKAGFRISPDGQYFSYRADYKGKTNIFVQKTSDTTAVRVTNDTLRSISSYFWKGDRIVYAQDIGGDENFQLFSVKPDGSDMKALTPFPGYRSDVYDDFRFIPGKEKVMLVGINKRIKEYFDPYLLNIETGELTLLYENKQNFDSWYPDNTGTLRMATKTDGVNVTYLYRNTDKDSFQTLLTTNFKEGFYPQAFDAENKTIYVMSNLNRDKLTLVRYDPVAKKEVEELFKNNDYDLQGIDYDRKTNKLISVMWEGEKAEEHYFDKDRGDRIDALKKKFTGFDVMLTAYDDNMTKGIVWTGNDVTPAKYYLYDFATRETKEVANAYPWLNAEDLAPMKPIQYKTRDGLNVHAYLTLPKGMAAKNLPVVINPHGGPWARDSWGYDPEVQFLANRGYAVLQMNYRGSTGYGKQFWESSFKQWGKKMQDDITDGVEYLKKEGIADPKRIAIYGGSYGGYATLAGVTFTPDLYACAVDYVGVSNLFTFMKTIPPYWKPYLDQFYEMVGSPAKDSVLLAEASPVLHVDKIKTPLFIAQGANDPRVNKAESDQMVAALKARGIDVQYMIKNNEGHGFHNEDNRFDFYGAMEEFLAKYLKPQKVANQVEMPKG